MLMISWPNALLCVLIPLVCYLLTKFLFKKDTEIENRRRAAAKLASTLKEQGLRRVPDFLIDYSVGDYSGMFHHMQTLAELFMSGEAAVVEEFQGVFARVLETKLRNPESRAYLAARLAEAAPVGEQKPSITASAAVTGESKVVGQTTGA